MSPGPVCPMAITTVHHLQQNWNVKCLVTLPTLFLFYSNKISCEQKAVSCNFLNLTHCVPSKMTKPIPLLAKIVLYQSTFSPAVKLIDVFKIPKELLLAAKVAVAKKK